MSNREEAERLAGIAEPGESFYAQRVAIEAALEEADQTGMNRMLGSATAAEAKVKEKQERLDRLYKMYTDTHNHEIELENKVAELEKALTAVRLAHSKQTDVRIERVAQARREAIEAAAFHWDCECYCCVMRRDKIRALLAPEKNNEG